MPEKAYLKFIPTLPQFHTSISALPAKTYLNLFKVIPWIWNCPVETYYDFFFFLEISKTRKHPRKNNRYHFGQEYDKVCHWTTILYFSDRPGGSWGHTWKSYGMFWNCPVEIKSHTLIFDLWFLTFDLWPLVGPLGWTPRLCLSNSTFRSLTRFFLHNDILAFRLDPSPLLFKFEISLPNAILPTQRYFCSGYCLLITAIFSHNVYAEGLLFSRPWVCWGWLLESSSSDPPVPPGTPLL